MTRSRSAVELGRAPSGRPACAARHGRPPGCLDSAVPGFTSWRLARGFSRQLFALAALRRGQRCSFYVVRSWENGLTTPGTAMLDLIASMAGEGRPAVAAWFSPALHSEVS